MPSKCKCGGELIGITPDWHRNRLYFEAKCDKCGVVRRQRKRQKEARAST